MLDSAANTIIHMRIPTYPTYVGYVGIRMCIIVLAALPIYLVLSALCQVWFHFGPKYFNIAGQILH